VTQQSTNGGNNDQYKSHPPANFDCVRGSAEGYNNNNNSNVGPSSSTASNYYNAAEGGAGQYVYNRGGGGSEGSGIAGDDALVNFETQQNVHWYTGDMYGSFVTASHINSSSSNAAALDSVATTNNNTLQSPSPLDPLLKHLKHKYATSAGPRMFWHRGLCPTLQQLMNYMTLY